jgi:hypothetical protein
LLEDDGRDRGAREGSRVGRAYPLGLAGGAIFVIIGSSGPSRYREVCALYSSAFFTEAPRAHGADQRDGVNTNVNRDWQTVDLLQPCVNSNRIADGPVLPFGFGIYFRCRAPWSAFIPSRRDTDKLWFIVRGSSLNRTLLQHLISFLRVLCVCSQTSI